ncbi:MAG: hypothetical protein JW969_17515 [Spirochaetales bacterium]|nr:hypothetical protein [Spirochaetales bacterium]
MEEISKEIKIRFIDRDINRLLSTIGNSESELSRHYTQNEEFFVSLKRDFIVPHFPIHHDIGNPIPEKHYLQSLSQFLNQITPIASHLLKDLIYFFEPEDILRPAFFKLYRIENIQYIYLLKLDLLFRSQYADIVESGDNDVTSKYRTRHIFLEANFVPLDSVKTQNGKVESFVVKRTISDTWIGEQGRGYFVQGIWIDDDLSKFFSKLFIPSGKVLYPYYPFVCKYKTICQNIISFSPEKRKRALPYLHKAFNYIAPVIDRIQKSLKNKNFSEDLDIFSELKQNIPGYWARVWENISSIPYLNANNMKEFKIDIADNTANTAAEKPAGSSPAGI